MSARDGRHRTGRPLPAVPPRFERGHVYRSEYTWQETICGRKGPPWLNDPTRCTEKPNCGCSDFTRLKDASSDVCDRLGMGIDNGITPRQALKLARRHLPWLRSQKELFLLTAWQPFKLVFERGSVTYVDRELVVWAKARAAGKLAPWEQLDPTLPISGDWAGEPTGSVAA